MAKPGPSRDYELPHTAPFHNEGKTVAGWLLFWAICVGALVVGLGFVFWQAWIAIVGIVIIVVGLVVSRVLSGMGMGQPNGGSRQRRAGEPDWYA